jgi:hypothetical protein
VGGRVGDAHRAGGCSSYLPIVAGEVASWSRDAGRIMSAGGLHGRIRYDVPGRRPNDLGTENETRGVRDGSRLVTSLSEQASVQVDPDGNVRIETRCDCALLHVKREQGQELWNAFQTWQAAYWRPTAINREFARHFQEPSIWQRLYRGLKIMVRQTFRHTGQSGIVLARERARLRLEGRLLSSGSNRNGSAPRLDALN